MTRAQIISDLLDCLTDMGPANGQPLAADTIMRGIHLSDEFNDLPGIALFNERVETIDSTDKTAERKLIMHVWGYVSAVNNDFSDLDDLAESVLMALADSDLNPHWARTSCGNLEVYEGGAADPLGIFDLEMTVDYESAINTL